MNHRISVRSAKRGVRLPAPLTRLIKAAAVSALQAEGYGLMCEVSIFYTDDEGIRAVNREHRGLDKPTDVLSFPMLSLIPGEIPQARPQDLDPENGALLLGDIVLSQDRIFAQAEQYGHSVEREAAFLTVHSMLHLLGYDHETGEADQARMFARTEEILHGIGLDR